jgi:hypothetical protein
VKHIDFISTDLAGLSEALMQTREEMNTNQRRLDRFDRAITAYMWELERFPAKNALLITPRDVQQMLDALLVFTETGQSIGVLDKAIKELQ